MIVDILVITVLVLIAAFIIERFILLGYFTGSGWLAVLALGLLLGVTHTARAGGQWGPYPAKVTEIIDGDTFRALIETYPNEFILRSVRLAYIDTPEKSGQCERESQYAIRAEARAAELIGGAGARIAIIVQEIDSFGRPVARAIAEGEDIGQVLLDEGLARRYRDGQWRDGYWCLEINSKQHEGE